MKWAVSFISTIVLFPIIASAQSFVASEMTPMPMVSVQVTALPTAYATPQYIATPTNGALRSLTVDNATGSTEIHCAYGGSTTTHFSVPAGSVYTDNFGDRSQVMPRAVGCINPASATPSTGTVRIYGDR